jgi:GR25 family glycosyltransferase involved in LPS biosynthesis
MLSKKILKKNFNILKYIISLMRFLFFLLIVYFFIYMNDVFLSQPNNDQIFDKDVSLGLNGQFCPVYIINLPETYNGNLRWKIIKNLKHPFYSWNLTRFIGINGKTYDYRLEIENNILKEFSLKSPKTPKSHLTIYQHQRVTKDDIGVSLSHYKLWNHIVKSNKASIIMGEANINISVNFLADLEKSFKQLPLDWDIMLIDFQLLSNSDVQSDQIISKVNETFLTQMYIISPTGAKKAISLVPIDMPLSSWLSSHTKELNIYRPTRNFHS